MDKRYQVFVSSTYTDLVDERKEATQAILKCNCFPAGMELFPASNKQQWDVIKHVIDDSDFYLLILAGRYGSLGKNDAGEKVSYTEMEFDYALSHGKPIIAMIYRNPENLPARLTERTKLNTERLKKFREKAMTGRMVAFWENKDQLNGEIVRSLHNIMNDTPEAIGWVRANAINDLHTLEEGADLEDITVEEICDRLEKTETAEEKIYLIDDLESSVRKQCFENHNFLQKFRDLVNSNQPTQIICDALDLLPYNMETKRHKRIIESLDIKNLFLAQFREGSIYNSEIVEQIVRLLNRMDIYSFEYSEPLLKCLKSGCSSQQKEESFVNYISQSGLYSVRQDKGKKLIQYVLKELTNEKRVISTEHLSELLVSCCDTEDSYSIIYNTFINSNLSVQKEILENIFEFCDADFFMEDPKIQKMLFNICDIVFSWNDDQITAELLLYCLFDRTYDVFVEDEIFAKLDDFNDDVFYIFFWNLSMGQFGRGKSEYYELKNSEKEKIVKIIKRRKHPREAKLLEQY